MAAYVFQCEVCGEPFEATRAHARKCSHRCHQAAYRCTHRPAEGGRDDHLLRAADAARALVAQGELHPLDALDLVTDPSPSLREALAA
jgi:hypothetical protein